MMQRHGTLIFTVAASLGIGIVGVAFSDPALQTIIQKGRHFGVPDVTLPVGGTLHFDNEDEFIHQIYVKSPNFNFESAEQPPGQFVDVKFTKAGTFTVLCEIHPKMHLTVNVQ
jgi:plastocyanin